MGAVHTSGLIVAQIWVIDEAKEAPAFANSLYISFINLGVSLGSLAGVVYCQSGDPWDAVERFAVRHAGDGMHRV